MNRRKFIAVLPLLVPMARELSKPKYFDMHVPVRWKTITKIEYGCYVDELVSYIGIGHDDIVSSVVTKINSLWYLGLR